MLVYLSHCGGIKIASSLFDVNPGDAICEQVLMRPQITLRSANVYPISPRRDVSIERLAALEQIWKQSIFKRVVFSGRNELKHFWLEHISARGYRVASDLVGLGLFQEAPDLSIRFSFNQAVR